MDGRPTEWKIHTPEELSRIIGKKIANAARLCFSEDSVVILLDLEDGSRQVYKSQAGPSAEAEFYRRVRSELLPEYRILIDEPDLTVMLFSYIDSPPLSRMKAAAEEAIVICDAIHEKTRNFQPPPPFRWRFDSPESLTGLFRDLLEKLRRFSGESSTCSLKPETLEVFADLRIDGLTDDLWNESIQLIHGDLNADNVFRLPGGKLKVIDWQTPLVAPAILEKAFLLESLDFDAEKHLGTQAALASNILRFCATTDAFLRLANKARPPERMEKFEKHMLYCLCNIFRHESNATKEQCIS